MKTKKDYNESLKKKLKAEGRSKNWFISTYCKGQIYNTVNMQILGYNTLQPEIAEAIEKYLAE
jgi:hypothetical protein